ncbi:MAG: porin family protein [Salinivirgaceae bacterium]|nr:porin family protein [Salinivirgaceae bacterium]
MVKTKYISILVLLFATTITIAMGQKRQVWNKPLYDEYPYHFGFALGVNTFTLRTVNSSTFFELEDIYSIESERQPGFSILMVGNLRLAHNLDLRFTPGLIFGQRNLHYLIDTVHDSQIQLTEHVMRIESTYATFPLLLKYRSIRLNNYRPYIIAGINYAFDLESEKKIRDQEKPKIRFNRHDVYLEAGFGIDYYFPFFKLSSEIKFSVGLLDILRRDDTQYTDALEKVNSRIFSVLFYFE